MKSLDYKEIAKRLKARRTALGMTYQELADKASMSKSTLQRYETGAIKNIPIARLQALSSALDMSPNELIGVQIDPKQDAPAILAGALDKDDLVILEYYHTLSSDQKAFLLATLQALSEQNQQE